MFESISVLPSTIRKHPLDIGDLAEKMFYYKDVNLFVGKEELKTLFESFDLDLLVEFLKQGRLKIHNRKKHYGVMTTGESTYFADFFFDKNYDLKKIIYDA